VTCVADWFGPTLPERVSFIGLQHCSVPLDVVQRSEERQRLRGYLTAVIGVQVEELASRVRRASDFSDALLEGATG